MELIKFIRTPKRKNIWGMHREMYFIGAIYPHTQIPKKFKFRENICINTQCVQTIPTSQFQFSHLKFISGVSYLDIYNSKLKDKKHIHDD